MQCGDLQIEIQSELFVCLFVAMPPLNGAYCAAAVAATATDDALSQLVS